MCIMDFEILNLIRRFDFGLKSIFATALAAAKNYSAQKGVKSDQEAVMSIFYLKQKNKTFEPCKLFVLILLLPTFLRSVAKLKNIAKMLNMPAKISKLYC